MKVLDDLLDLIYPPRCAFCQKLLRNRNKAVCQDCLDHLPYTGDLAKRMDLKYLDCCASPLFYENSVRDSLHRFKFSQRTGYAGIYAGFMVKCIDEKQKSCDIISWAPVSGRRKRRRGYDQSELLARELSLLLDIPCRRSLVKQRDTKPQSHTKSAAERRENVKGAYRCSDPELVRGKRILLVDDILTSGSTLSECAKVLKDAGASGICAITVARKR